MSNRFDKRLEEAGLLKHSDNSSPPPPPPPPHRRTPITTPTGVDLSSCSPASTTPSSSTEDLMNNSQDPGYARLAILPTGPPSILKKNETAFRETENGEEEFGGVVMEEEDEEGGYANPADALKMIPRVQQISKQQQFTNSPSPPPSPVTPPEHPPKALPKAPPTAATNTTTSVSAVAAGNQMSGYESVDEIRKMREKQLRDREKREHNSSSWSHASGSGDSTGSGGGGVSPLGYDENPGYSQPFNALKSHRSHLGLEKPPASLSWQRTGSNGKKKNEPSAKFLHLVGASSPVGPGKGLPPDDAKPEDYVSPVRSASTSARMTTRVTAPPGGLGLGGGGGGGRRSLNEPPSPMGSKSGNQTVVERLPLKVNRFILEVDETQNGDGGEEERPVPPPVGLMGRSHSVGSSFSSQKPAKITKLRTGHVTVVSGKAAGNSRSPKNDKQ